MVLPTALNIRNYLVRKISNLTEGVGILASRQVNLSNLKLWNALTALYVYFFVRCPHTACCSAQNRSRRVQKAGRYVH